MIMLMPVWCLNVHATWRCHHAGACCSAGWAIPVEGPAFERLTVHFGRERENRPLFLTGGPLPEGAAAIVGRKPAGSCVFFQEASGRLCEVHAELGAGSLPAACRQFPRIVLDDPRGTFVTLSHFCPTAAELLLDARDVRIVNAPPNLALDGEVEGLDATRVLPPLLGPGLLTDIEGYAAWERNAIDVLACGKAASDTALATIARATGMVERWRPGEGPLEHAVHRAFAAAAADPPDLDLVADTARRFLAISSVPAGLSRPDAVECAPADWERVARWWPAFDHAVRAWLAARVFGNWIAYSGRGLRAVVEYLRVSLAVLRIEAVRQERLGRHRSERRRFIEAVRQSDLLLVHLSDASTLARLVGHAASSTG